MKSAGNRDVVHGRLQMLHVHVSIVLGCREITFAVLSFIVVFLLEMLLNEHKKRDYLRNAHFVRLANSLNFINIERTQKGHKSPYSEYLFHVASLYGL